LHEIVGSDGYQHDVLNILREDVSNHHEVSLKKLLSMHLVSSRPGFMFILKLSHENGHEITTSFVYVRARRVVILHFIDSVDTKVLSEAARVVENTVLKSLTRTFALSVLHFNFDLHEIGGDETSDLSLEHIKPMSIEESFENTGIIDGSFFEIRRSFFHPQSFLPPVLQLSSLGDKEIQINHEHFSLEPHQQLKPGDLFDSFNEVCAFYELILPTRYFSKV